MLGLVEPLRTGSIRQRASRTWRRLFAETGIVRGASNELASALRNVKETRARCSVAEDLNLSSSEVHDLSLLRRDLMLSWQLDDARLCSDVIEYAAELQQRFAQITFEHLLAERSHHNYFFCNVYEGRADDPFRRLALHPRLLRLTTAYFGQMPVLQDIEYNYSPPQEVAPAAWSGSQLWHVDHDQRRKLKVFVNTHDMTPAHGPTLVLDRCRSALRYRPNFPRCFSDDEARAVGVDPTMHRMLIGKAGSMHIVDTARLVHCGSRVVKQRRFLLVLTYGPTQSRLSAANEARCLRASHLTAENTAMWRRLAEASSQEPQWSY
jgi:hypothetical protein